MSSLTIYQVSAELQAQLDDIDPETGELGEGYANALGLMKNKTAAVGAYIAQRELEVDAAKARLKELAEQVKRVERRNGWLREHLAMHMANAGITEVRMGDIGLIKCYPFRDASVDIFDEKQVPADYFEQPPPPPPKVSKARIGEALKAGADVPGARIVKRHRLSIK